jgi:hypothetical protein
MKMPRYKVTFIANPTAELEIDSNETDEDSDELEEQAYKEFDSNDAEYELDWEIDTIERIDE